MPKESLLLEIRVLHNWKEDSWSSWGICDTHVYIFTSCWNGIPCILHVSEPFFLIPWVFIFNYLCNLGLVYRSHTHEGFTVSTNINTILTAVESSPCPAVSPSPPGHCSLQQTLWCPPSQHWALNTSDETCSTNRHNTKTLPICTVEYIVYQYWNLTRGAITLWATKILGLYHNARQS